MTEFPLHPASLRISLNPLTCIIINTLNFKGLYIDALGGCSHSGAGVYLACALDVTHPTVVRAGL